MIDLTADELFEIERALLREGQRLMEQKHNLQKLGFGDMVDDIEHKRENNDNLLKKIASMRVEHMTSWSVGGNNGL